MERPLYIVYNPDTQGMILTVLVVTPSGVSTCTAAEPSAIPVDGITTTMEVAVLLVTVAFMVAILTPTPAAKPVPVMVIVPPLATLAGAIDVITGGAPAPVTVIFPLAVPFAFETSTTCDPTDAPAGTLVVREVDVLSSASTAIPPIRTEASSRFFPVMTIWSPVSTLEGVILSIEGPLPPDPSFEQEIAANIIIHPLRRIT